MLQQLQQRHSAAMAARPLARSVLAARSTPLSPGAIAGAVIGSIVGVVIIAICLFPFIVRARRRWLSRYDEPTLAEMGQSPGGPIFPAQDLDDKSSKRCSGSGLENGIALDHPQPASPDHQPQPATVPQGVAPQQGLPSPTSSLSPVSRANSSLGLAHVDSQAASPVAASAPAQLPTEASFKSHRGSRGTVGRESPRELSFTESYGPPSRELTHITSVGITEEPESFEPTPHRQHSKVTDSIRSLIHRRHSSQQRRDSKRSTSDATDRARSPSIVTNELLAQTELTPSGLEIDPNTVGLAWDYYNDPTLGTDASQQLATVPTSFNTLPPTHATASVPISPVSPIDQSAPFMTAGPVTGDAISQDSDKTITAKAPTRSFSRQSTFALGQKPLGPLQRTDSLPPPTIVNDIPSPPLQYTIGPSGNPMEMMKPTNPAESAWMLEHEMRMIQNPPPQPPAEPDLPVPVPMPVPVNEPSYVIPSQDLEPNYQAQYQSPYQSPYQPALDFEAQLHVEPAEYYNPTILTTTGQYATPPPSTGPSAQSTPDTRLTSYTASPSPPTDLDAVYHSQLAPSPGLSPGQWSGPSRGPSPGLSPGISSGPSRGPSPTPSPLPGQSPGRTFACDQCHRVFDQIHKLNHHRRYHERRHECPQPGCTMRFGTKTHLDRHINDKHNKTRKFYCTERGCPYSRQGGKSFPRKDNLRRHMQNKHQLSPDLGAATDYIDEAMGGT